MLRGFLGMPPRYFFKWYNLIRFNVYFVLKMDFLYINNDYNYKHAMVYLSLLEILITCYN